jgi:2C-methyl-D-erythritol 2,4-cyclodiphosphate synthase
LTASYDFSDPLCYPGSGSTVFDLEGSLNLPISGATFVSNGQGSYFNFNGSSYIGAKNLNLLPSDNTFSMNMWARKDAVASGGIAFLLSIGANPGPSGTNPYITANEVTEKYSVQFSNGIGAVFSTSEIPNSVWTMITYTANGTNSKIYIDGVLDGTASQGIGSNPSSNATLYIGAVTDGSNNPLVSNRLTGDIAIVEIYDSTLSAGDILTLYNDTKNRFGLVVSYDFSDPACYPGTGNTVFDLTANNLDLPIVNATYSANGQASYFSFNGSNAYIGQTGVTGVGSTFTISFWAQQNTSNPQVPFSCGYVGSGGRGVQFTFSGTISYDLSASFNFGIGYVNSLSTHSPNTWDMYTYTCDGTTSKLYINGVIQGSDTQDSAFWDTGSFAIGANTNSSGNITTGGDSLNGKIALLDVYNVALSAGDITTLFNDTKIRFDNLIYSYDFSDPACYPGSGSTVFDLSGSELDLPIVNATYGGTGQSKYFNFDGNGDYIGKTSVTGLGNTFTANMWYELTAVNSTIRSLWQVGVNSASGTNPGFVLNYPSTADLIYGFSFGVGTTSATGVLTANTWQMGTVTADGTTTKIYVNGVLAGSVAQGIGNWATGGFAIGAGVDGSGNISAGSDGFLGHFALLDVYNVALSAGDITTIYNDTETRFGAAPSPYAGIVGGRQFAQGFNG